MIIRLYLTTDEKNYEMYTKNTQTGRLWLFGQQFLDQLIEQ